MALKLRNTYSWICRIYGAIHGLLDEISGALYVAVLLDSTHAWQVHATKWRLLVLAQHPYDDRKSIRVSQVPAGDISEYKRRRRVHARPECALADVFKKMNAHLITLNSPTFSLSSHLYNLWSIYARTSNTKNDMEIDTYTSTFMAQTKQPSLYVVLKKFPRHTREPGAPAGLIATLIAPWISSTNE